MTKISILEELKLAGEAAEVRKDGKGWKEVANIMNQRHPEIEERYGKPLSHMGAKRGIVSWEKRQMEESLDNGEDILDLMQKEFREAIRKNTKKINGLVETADEVLKDALNEGTITEKTKALKAVADSLGQEVKNWIALQQYGIRQAGHIGSINLKKEQALHIHLDRWTDKLIQHKKDFCKDCQKVIDDLLNDLFEDK